MFDGKAYGEGIVEIVKGYVERELAPLKAENEKLLARVAELEARPAPEKGEKGDPGDAGKDGRDGADGSNGRDAAGIVEALKDAGELVLTLEDGRLIRTGIRDGAKGEDGKNGLDGFNLEDFDVAKGDDGRTFVLKFDRGDVRHEYELTFPCPVYCGVFKEGDSYVPGDLTTWGGELWHCDKETTAKPGTDDWTLAVKKGRNGKDAKPNG